jgi:putative transcription factor
MMCDMCGAEDDLFKADVEGTILNVCKNCARYGKVLARIAVPVKEKPKSMARAPVPEKGELIQVLVEDYPERVKKAREKIGLMQKELAVRMAEKESMIQKVESGQIEPSLELARKFENHLRIKLVEQHEEKKDKKYKAGSGGMTIGDILTK